MSGAALIERAAGGELPEWTEASSARRAHTARVVALLDEWAARLGLDAAERSRWRAAGWLHDALRDADPARLRDRVPAWARELPASVLHGPAAAARLEDEGVRDRSILNSVAYHTLGHPELDRLGRAVYLADYLEPGRAFEPIRRAALRARMPEAFDSILEEVIASRLAFLLRSGRRLRAESVGFWNSVAGDS